MTIRVITVEDIGEIAEIERECFSQPWTEKALLSHLQADGNIAFCAQIGAAVAGYLLAGYVFDEISLWRICVNPQYRRRGIGRQLLVYLSARYPNAAVFLEVRMSNDAAVALYEKQGYTRIGKRPRFYEKPVEDALLMAYYNKNSKEKAYEDTGN